MSTVVYGAITKKREEAEPGTSRSTSPPGVQSYVDILAALVPTEVLTAHAVLLSITTKTDVNQGGNAVTTITEPATLAFVFWALCVVSAGLYWLSHRSTGKRWDRADWVRLFIPPLAFVGWTMLQKATAFDAIAPGLRQAPREAIAVLGAIVLGVIVQQLVSVADLKGAGDRDEDASPQRASTLSPTTDTQPNPAP